MRTVSVIAAAVVGWTARGEVQRAGVDAGDAVDGGAAGPELLVGRRAA